jgi:hypothetical protein
MRIPTKIALLMATLALGVAPALALGAGAPGPPSTTPAGPPSTTPAGPPSTTPSGTTPQPPENPGTQNKPKTPGPGASLPAKAKAYGRYCQGESRKHVQGQHGTPFSQCVTAMAKLATGQTHDARSACKALSKKHVDGQRGTPFSQCISGAAKLLRRQGQS